MENFRKEELLQILEDLLLIYSPSRDEKNLANYIENFLKDLGAEIYLDKSFASYGGNAPTIFAKIKGDLKGEGLTFSAHMDVVEPNKGLKIIKEGNVWKSDGRTTLGADDKAGVAGILYILKYMVEEKISHKDIYAIFTPGEEEGMLGAKSIDWEEVYRHMNPAKNMIVLDNAGRADKIAYKAPTSYNYAIEFFGKTAHAGIEPEKGISSIKLLSSFIAKMPNGRIDESTTANVSKLESDFPSNVVPDYARASGEIRALTKERVEEVLEIYENLAKEVTKDSKSSYKFSYEEDYPPLASKDDLAFAKDFKKTYKEFGVDADLQVIGGGSDANFFAKEGFNSIILGVGMEKVHTKEEYLEIDQLVLTVKAILSYMKKM